MSLLGVVQKYKLLWGLKLLTMTSCHFKIEIKQNNDDICEFAERIEYTLQLSNVLLEYVVGCEIIGAAFKILLKN